MSSQAEQLQQVMSFFKVASATSAAARHKPATGKPAVAPRRINAASNFARKHAVTSIDPADEADFAEF
jgi:hypothetical protein